MSHKNRTHWAATKLRQVEKVEGTSKVAFGSEIDIQWSCHHWNADWFMVQNPYSPAYLVIPAYKWVGSHPPTGNKQNKTAQEAPISRLDMTGSLPEMGKFSFWAKKNTKLKTEISNQGNWSEPWTADPSNARVGKSKEVSRRCLGNSRLGMIISLNWHCLLLIWVNHLFMGI